MALTLEDIHFGSTLGSNLWMSGEQQEMLVQAKPLSLFQSYFKELGNVWTCPLKPADVDVDAVECKGKKFSRKCASVNKNPFKM